MNLLRHYWWVHTWKIIFLLSGLELALTCGRFKDYNLIKNWTNMSVQRTRPQQLCAPLTTTLGNPKSMQCNLNSCSFNCWLDYISPISQHLLWSDDLLLWTDVGGCLEMLVVFLEVFRRSSHTWLRKYCPYPVHSFVLFPDRDCLLDPSCETVRVNVLNSSLIPVDDMIAFNNMVGSSWFVDNRPGCFPCHSTISVEKEDW